MKDTPYIPVMGTGFTIDAPLKVAKYGISSTISVVQDELLETMRAYHSNKRGLEYSRIERNSTDFRARRVTAYLNLINELVQKEATETGVVPGRIDVNIMSKLDSLRLGVPIPDGANPNFYRDAVSAFRGYANSDLSNSRIILSAGAPTNMLGTIGDFADIMKGKCQSIALKVSDARSASILGRKITRKGGRISEYRIEGGLLCGGHAFGTKGILLHEILAEASEKRDSLPFMDQGCELNYQGGITNHDHIEWLKQFNIDGIGIGTPWMIVPEVVDLDSETEKILLGASPCDVVLSNASPLGLPFWNIMNLPSERARVKRNATGDLGAICKYGHLRLTEVDGEQVCLASKQGIKRALASGKFDLERLKEYSCICGDLGGAALKALGIEKETTPAACPGRNISYFSSTSTINGLLQHFRGEIDLTDGSVPTMPEMDLVMQIEQLEKNVKNCIPKSDQFKENIVRGISSMRTDSTLKDIIDLEEIARLETRLEKIQI